MTTPPGCGGQLGGSQFRTIVKSAAINTHGWVFGCEYVSISGGSPPREEFLALYMLDFCRHYRFIFSRGFTSSAPTTSGWEFPLCHILVSTWIFLPFHFSHPGGCTAVSHCGVNFPSVDD